MWNNHMTEALPCINPQQKAAKTTSKDQQTLVSEIKIIDTLLLFVFKSKRGKDIYIKLFSFYQDYFVF
jgi:hypothetical protein